MVYTVTLNPSLDYVVGVEKFQDNTINRAKSENIYPGGKGNNVAVIVSELGTESKALGFKAGFTGNIMEEMLRTYKCNTNFIPLEEGMTRINVKVKSDTEFEINGQGPNISEEKVQALLNKLDEIIDGDVLVLSGSIPKTLPSDIYERILARLQDREILIFVDTTKKLLFNTLKYHPFLIKPNLEELEEMFECKIKEEEEIIKYARKLQDMGAKNVLVSMACKGAILLTQDQEIKKMSAPKGVVINSVGAGDSMLAGFLVGYLKNKDFTYALRLGTAAGSATAFTSGLADKDKIFSLLNSEENSVQRILEILDQEYGTEKSGFYHHQNWQLLIAIMLSAQSTDKQVDEVIPALFDNFREVEKMADAPVEIIESYIRSIGLYKSKAKNIKACCRKIVDEYNGEVPTTIEGLLTLAGVGRKTATLYLADAYGIPGVTVDTHVFRISKRLGWAKGNNPEQVEKELEKVLPKDHWNRINFQLIYHGRAVCTARKAKCEQCILSPWCEKIMD